MSDIKLLFSEALDIELYAYKLFPAIAGSLAALALYSVLRKRMNSLPLSVSRTIRTLALPFTILPAAGFFVLRAASASPALDPYLTGAGCIFSAVALVALLKLRSSRKDPAGAAAAILAAVCGAAVAVATVLLMVAVMQLPQSNEPLAVLLGVLVPVGLTASLLAWPVVRHAFGKKSSAIGVLAGICALAVVAVGAILFWLGLPRQLPEVSVVAITAFPLAAAVGMRAARHVPIKTYMLLATLRMLTVAGMVLFLARPMLSIQDEQARKPVLAFAIDTSASMSSRDGANSPTRLDWVRQTLGASYLDRLAQDFDLVWFSFASGTKKITRDDLKSIAADGKTTDVAQAAAHIKSSLADANLASLLLITDGADTSGGRDPARVIAENGVVVNTVGVGALSEKEETGDVAIVHVESPRYATVNNVTEVRVHVKTTGITGRTELVLKSGNKELARKNVDLDPGQKTQVVPVQFTPDAVGSFDYEVTLPANPQERIEQNNSYPFSIVVTDPKIKVLYIEGTPRYEYKYLRRTLSMDPNVELLSFVQISKDRFTKQGEVTGVDIKFFPTDLETLKKFDVIIIGDVDSSLFSSDQFNIIEQAVSDGAGLLMLGGMASFGPGGYAGTKLADVLPVELGGLDDKQYTDNFQLTLTDEGREHPIFRGTLDFFAGERADQLLPELQGNTEVTGKKPAAQVLAINPTSKEADGQPSIVAAVQQYGAGRSMAFTADSTWKWYMQMRGLGLETPYMKFWGQTIRWLAQEEVKEREQKAGVTAFVDKKSFSPGERVRIFARARTEGGLATNDAAIHATITAPSGAETLMQLAYVPRTTGEYEGTFEPPAPGEYTVAVTAIQNDNPLGEKIDLGFRVGSPNLEFDDLSLNEKLLKRIAAETGGQYCSLLRLDDLVKKLQANELKQRNHREVSLWDYALAPIIGGENPNPVQKYIAALLRDPQGIYLVFLIIVTLEWTIRKRRMLS